MKKTFLFFIILIESLSFAQNVNIANQSYSVIFEDSALNANMKTNITEDITRYFLFADEFGDCFVSSWTDENVLHPAVPVFNGLNRHYEQGLRCHTHNSNTNIYIYRTLSNTYADIYEKLNSLTNAYENAMNFIDSLNTGSITNLLMSEQVKYIQFNPNRTNLPSNHEQTISNLHNYWAKDVFYFPICVIDFSKQKFWGNTIECYCFLFRYKEKGNKKYNPLDKFYLIYYNNRWSLYGYDWDMLY